MLSVLSNPEIHAALKSLGFTSKAATDIMEDQVVDNLEELMVLKSNPNQMPKELPYSDQVPVLRCH